VRDHIIVQLDVNARSRRRSKPMTLTKPKVMVSN
jgi:hypothetical protein